MALENNSDVKISSSELDAAKAGLDAARAARWGSIDFAHSTGRNMRYKTAAGATLATGPVGTNSSTNTVSISVPIYTGGRLEGQIEEAKANQKYYEYGMNSAYQTTRYNAAKGYYDVLESINTVNLQKETVDRLAEHLRNTQSQFNVGVSAKVDVLRSQVELVDAQQTLTQAQNNYDVAVATLNNVLGLPTGTPLSLSEGLEYKPNDYTLDNCLSYAMLNRPEIHQAQASVDMAKAEQKIANAATLPQLSLSAANGWADDRFPGAHKYEWSVGASVDFNIWDYGVNAAKIRQAKANVVKAEESYRQISDQVNLAVRTSYLSMREAENASRQRKSRLNKQKKITVSPSCATRPVWERTRTSSMLPLP